MNSREKDLDEAEYKKNWRWYRNINRTY
jgi:hypothetical protein